MCKKDKVTLSVESISCEVPFMRVVGPNTVRDKEQFVGTADDGGCKEVNGRNCRNGMGRCCWRRSYCHNRKLGN